jgi:RNA recognition motif-containing protein
LQRRLYSNEIEQGERRVEGNLTEVFPPVIANYTDSPGRFSIESNDQPAVSSPITEPGNGGELARAFRPHRNADGSELTPTTQLFVGNMLYDVTSDDLKQEMANFGEVLGSRIVMRNGRSRGFVFPFDAFSLVVCWALNNPIIFSPT